MIHAFQLLFTDCNYPRAFVWWIGMHAVMFYFLFADFYKQSYKKRAARQVRVVIIHLRRSQLTLVAIRNLHQSSARHALADWFRVMTNNGETRVIKLKVDGLPLCKEKAGSADLRTTPLS